LNVLVISRFKSNKYHQLIFIFIINNIDNSTRCYIVFIAFNLYSIQTNRYVAKCGRAPVIGFSLKFLNFEVFLSFFTFLVNLDLVVVISEESETSTFLYNSIYSVLVTDLLWRLLQSFSWVGRKRTGDFSLMGESRGWALVLLHKPVGVIGRTWKNFWTMR
jgi:hypothetical protein